MADREELKSCPFCKGIPVKANPFLMDDTWSVYCDLCDAKGPSADTEAEAIEQWNKREK